MARAGEFDAAAIVAGDLTGPGGSTRPCTGSSSSSSGSGAGLACNGLAWAAGYERRDVLTLKWLTAGLDWRLLAVTGLGVVLLVWLPWRYVYWRPRALPASTTESSLPDQARAHLHAVAGRVGAGPVDGRAQGAHACDGADTGPTAMIATVAQ